MKQEHLAENEASEKPATVVTPVPQCIPVQAPQPNKTYEEDEYDQEIEKYYDETVDYPEFYVQSAQMFDPTHKNYKKNAGRKNF